MLKVGEIKPSNSKPKNHLDMEEPACVCVRLPRLNGAAALPDWMPNAKCYICGKKKTPECGKPTTTSDTAVEINAIERSLVCSLNLSSPRVWAERVSGFRWVTTPWHPLYVRLMLHWLFAVGGLLPLIFRKVEQGQWEAQQQRKWAGKK